jgi:hypothetical protein
MEEGRKEIKDKKKGAEDEDKKDNIPRWFSTGFSTTLEAEFKIHMEIIQWRPMAMLPEGCWVEQRAGELRVFVHTNTEHQFQYIWQQFCVIIVEVSNLNSCGPTLL